VSLFINFHLLFLIAHASQPIIDALVFAFTELFGLIISEELFCQRAFLLFFRQFVPLHFVLICHYGTYLEVSWKLFGVVGLVETIGVDEIPELHCTQICFHLFSELLLRHIVPSFTSCDLFLSFTLFFC
jgi:hypothetical protein